MPLTETQKKHLRGLAHTRRPIVMIGQQGLKETIFEELEAALAYHELVKIKISVGDRAARDEALEELRRRCGAELVQRVGNTAVLFRRNPKKPRIELPRG